MTFSKIDLAKTDKAYYSARQKVELAKISPIQFVSITGEGDPSSAGFVSAVEAQYSVAYTLKFESKSMGKDFVVARLEGQWWFDEDKYGKATMTGAPQLIPRAEWKYRLLIRMPEFVDEESVSHAAKIVDTKKGLALAPHVKFWQLSEGSVVQILYVGPFDQEPESLTKLQGFMDANGLKRNRLHHEIYLSDVRKTAPEKLKTILREPVK